MLLVLVSVYVLFAPSVCLDDFHLGLESDHRLGESCSFG